MSGVEMDDMLPTTVELKKTSSALSVSCLLKLSEMIVPALDLLVLSATTRR